MASSLDSLMNDLVKSGRKLSGFPKEQYELLLRKGIYMSSWDKFTETKLPPKEAFYSNLNMSNISDEDYEHTGSLERIQHEELRRIPRSLSQN